MSTPVRQLIERVKGCEGCRRRRERIRRMIHRAMTAGQHVIDRARKQREQQEQAK